ncbi:class I adenylate-forming enzyme family protein [soil metagenome]
MTFQDLLNQDFGTLPDLIRIHGKNQADAPALIQNDRVVSYGELDTMMDRVAAGLQRDGLKSRDIIAISAGTSIEYGMVFLGALRAGIAVAPLAPSSTADSLAMMIGDCGAKLLFLDADLAATLAPAAGKVSATRISLDDSDAGRPFTDWLAPADAKGEAVTLDPAQPFNIIYSSGTTGAPKGIVQSHQMRWQHMHLTERTFGCVSLISTGLYSNTTLVSFFPTLAGGGAVVLMAKFDVGKFLSLCETHAVTHAMLVPVQYKRIMEYPDFDRFDLSKFIMKFCTSAPFAAELKADVLRRWPGGLTEYYGMTEGGGGCVLLAHEHPDKLHTVGQPPEASIVLLIGEDGQPVAQGEVGEIVGHSASIMNEYWNQPGKTAEATWFDDQGRRFIRTGDVGRFDEDGFLILMDRKKDMIISGGFNVYPSDLEGVLQGHDAVAEAAVVGVSSDRWGETPVAFITLKNGAAADAEAIREWANGQLGKTQRIADIEILDVLPRSHIGKVLKRELRDAYKGKALA